ncbi:MAG: hypothetical protein IMZ66_02940, partial [Planctomycetes bacterium]|nr:hypothetical protein [Planctomycetota bacterium]
MIRYLGPILIVVMALGLTCGVAAVLVGGLAERLTAGADRLTVFDSVAATGDRGPVIRAALADADSGRAIPGALMAIRLENDWTTWTRTNATGVATRRGPAGLRAGMYGFRAGLSELHPRLDVWGPGTVWVWLPGTRVVWIDAAALVPAGGADLPAAAAQDLAAHVQVLAQGRRAVYLVTSDAADYAAVRRRLRMLGFPLGPAYWVSAGRELRLLKDLAQMWPRVDGAVLCGAEMV